MNQLLRLCKFFITLTHGKSYVNVILQIYTYELVMYEEKFVKKNSLEAFKGPRPPNDLGEGEKKAQERP